MVEMADNYCHLSITHWKKIALNSFSSLILPFRKKNVIQCWYIHVPRKDWRWDPSDAFSKNQAQSLQKPLLGVQNYMGVYWTSSPWMINQPTSLRVSMLAWMVATSFTRFTCGLSLQFSISGLNTLTLQRITDYGSRVQIWITDQDNWSGLRIQITDLDYGSG